MTTRAAALAGAAHGHTVLADEQSAGRGRRGRTWHSPPGANIYLSMVVRPALAPASAAVLTLAAGLAIVDAVVASGVEDSRVTIKWPNDVRIEGRKLGGVLVEGSLRGGTLSHAVIGIGINVCSDALPDEIAMTATSLRLATGKSLPRDEVVCALLLALEYRLDALLTDGGAKTVAAVSARCDTLGSRVRIDAIEGAAMRLSESGGLVVRGDDGKETEVRAGEVVVA